MNFFIVTDDQSTRSWLLQKGYPEIKSSGNTSVFINDPKMAHFSEDEKRNYKFWYSKVIVI